MSVPAYARLGLEPTCPRDAEGRPRRFSGGRGAYLYDPDGEPWIDLDNGRGSVFLGHGEPAVAEAVARAAAGHGGTTTAWGPLLDRVLERLGELLGGQSLALFRTGTAALRAVACTVREARSEELGVERPLILSAGYHGYDPMWRSPEEPFTENGDGIVDFLFDLDVLAERLADPRPVAALVISPDGTSLTPAWYESVRELARRAEVPIVADEVKVGLRYAPELLAHALEPDVWVVAKTIANGAPVSAVGGSWALLQGFQEISYTSFFEPTVLAAADATLELIATGEPQRRAAAAGSRFVAHARSVLERAALPIAVAGDGPMFHFVCASDEVDEALASACAAERLLLFAGDNQAPSAALAGAVDDACGRFDAAAEALAPRFAGLELDEGAWYTAAWHTMDGLADRPRNPDQTRRIAARLWEEE